MTQPTGPRAQPDVGSASAALLYSRERRRCPVCDGPVCVGAGVPTRYEGMTLVFRGPECRARFERDPERYLRTGDDAASGHDDTGGESPSSEWCCDR